MLLVALAVDVGARYVPAAQALAHGRDEVVQARALLTADLAHINRATIDQAAALLADAADDFGPRSQALQDGFLGSVAAHLPLFGPQLHAARLLRNAGERGAAVGLDVLGLVKQLLADQPGEQESLLQRLVAVAGHDQAQLNKLSADLASLHEGVNALPAGPLLGPLDSARNTLRSEGTHLFSAATPAIAILQALPAAVGSGDHTYLLLLENPGEERPGGGYIGAVGQVTFSNGAITSEIFRDASFSDASVRDIPAPRPLNAYLFHNQPWEMADAGWSPDFPTDVSDITRFYTRATGVHPEGVIAVDPIALSGVLSITGPLTVPPYPQTITSSNALTELNYITNKARPGDPGKVFLPPFGQAMVNRLVRAGLGQAPALAASLAQSARQKHVLLFFEDPHLQQLAGNAGFGGVVASPLFDSLQVVDGNLSGTKGDLFVKRRFTLRATVRTDGQVQDTLTMVYRNSAPTTTADAALDIGSGGDYRDYLQVLVPETAQFGSLRVSINDQPAIPVSPEAITYVYQRTDIAYWLIVPRGASAIVTLTYTGPFADITRSPELYQLSWEKQNGALTWPIDVAISMPGRAMQHVSAALDQDRSWSATAAG